MINKSVAVEFAVTDQFPMSSNSQITIETTAPKIKPDETLENVPILFGENHESGKRTASKLVYNSENILEWSFHMQPADVIAIPIEYSVTWPADYNISDL